MDTETSRVSEGDASLPHGVSVASLPHSVIPSRLPSLQSFSRVPSLLPNTAAAVVGGWETPVRGGAATVHVPARADVGERQQLRSELASVMQTPKQRSGVLSLQSSVNVLTPPLSNAHTPRAAAAAGFLGAATHGLAVFHSIPATPAAEVVVAVPADSVQGAKCRERAGIAEECSPPASATTAGPTELPMLDEKRPNYGGTRGKAGGEKGDANNSGDDDESNSNDSHQRSGIEFNSFTAMEASFMSNTSSHGSPSVQHNTLGKAVFHIFKGNVGAGVFLLPTYYQDTGYILGMICVTLLGLLMIDCALALLHAKHAINRAEVRTYPAVVDFVLGSWLRYFTDFALIFTQFGFCIMYIQYASSTFAYLFDFPHSYAVCIVLTVVLVTPMTFISNKMNILAYASMLAGLFVALVLAGTTVVDIQHLHLNGVAPGVAAFLPSARIIVFLSGHMFSLEGIGIVLPVENSLAPEHRKPFGKLVKYTLMGIVALYITFGVLGYCAYGKDLHTSVVLALPKSVMKKSLQCLLGLSLVFGYPIQYVPAIQLVDHAIRVSLRRDRAKAYLVRVVLNVLFGLFALFIGGDALNIFASFLGAFAGVHLMITIPSLLALQIDNALDVNRESLTYGQYMAQVFRGPFTWHRIRCFLYLFFALVVWIGGLYFTFVSVFGGTESADIDHTTTTTTTAAPNTTTPVL